MQKERGKQRVTVGAPRNYCQKQDPLEDAKITRQMGKDEIMPFAAIGMDLRDYHAR